MYISLIFTDELTRIIDNHPCCVAGDLFGRNVTGEGECFEEGKSVFNLTGSTGCSKVFYKCCKRYLQNGPQYSGCQFKIHKMSVKDLNRICQLKLLLSYFFHLRKDWKWGGKRIHVPRHWYFTTTTNEVLFPRILAIWGGHFGVRVNKCTVY